MNEKGIDALVIIAAGLLMMAIVWFGYGQLYLKFSVIPPIVFYFIGKYVQRKFVAEPNALNG